MTYDAVQGAQPDKTHKTGSRSPYKDGWSPGAMAHKAHLYVLIEIRRQIFEPDNRLKWTANSIQSSISCV